MLISAAFPAIFFFTKYQISTMLALTKSHRKSGKASINSTRVPGKFYINCAYYNQHGAKSLRLFSHGYKNKADAEGDLTLFEFAIETDGANNWKPDGGYYRPNLIGLEVAQKDVLMNLLHQV